MTDIFEPIALAVSNPSHKILKKENLLKRKVIVII